MIGKPFEISFWGNTVEVVLEEKFYTNRTLALILKEINGLPFATLSVNLPGSEALPKDHFYGKHWSENAGLLEELEKKGMIEKSTDLPILTSGFIRDIHAYKLIR